MYYRAEYEDEYFEIIIADNDREAFEEAVELEEEYGTLFNVFLLDENNEIVRTVF